MRSDVIIKRSVIFTVRALIIKLFKLNLVMRKYFLVLSAILLLLATPLFYACDTLENISGTNTPKSEMGLAEADVMVLTASDIFRIRILDLYDQSLEYQNRKLEEIKQLANTPGASCAQVAEMIDSLIQENQRVRTEINALNQRNAAELAEALTACDGPNPPGYCAGLSELNRIAPKGGACDPGNCLNIFSKNMWFTFPVDEEEITLVLLDNFGKPLIPEIPFKRKAGESFARANMNLPNISANTPGRLRLQSNRYAPFEINVIINSQRQ
jgi:hypothetical protein